MKKVISLVLGMFLSSSVFASSVSKSTVRDLGESTAMITNKGENSGGTGVILKSKEDASYILTNSHVCEVARNGGYVKTTKGKYDVDKFLQSETHDLCLIKVIANLGVDTPVASSAPETGDQVRISGHPFLMPQMVVEGNLAGYQMVTLVVGMEKCTEKDMEKYGLYCLFFGGIPLIKEFPARATSAFIAPGNSGSAVFNSDNEVVGLAFAGNGRGLSHGLIVPHEHIVSFLKTTTKSNKWVQASRAVKLSEMEAQSTRRRANNGLFISALQNNKLIMFPALFSEKFDRFFDLVNKFKSESK